MTTTLHPPTRIVVVTGPPASGKTTLALAVSEGLGVADVGQVRPELDRLDDLDAGLVTALQPEREDRVGAPESGRRLPYRTGSPYASGRPDCYVDFR